MNRVEEIVSSTLAIYLMFHPLKNIIGLLSVSPLLNVKIVNLVDRPDLYKISNLVYDGREIVRSLYSSLRGQRVLWRV